MTYRLITGLTVGALIIAIAAGLRFAVAAGLLDEVGARQITQILIGLGLAAYANLMPKQIGAAHPSPLVQARAQSARRVGGWSFALAGLTYAGLWAFAPAPFADEVSMVPIAGAMVITLAYAVWCFASCRMAASPGSR